VPHPLVVDLDGTLIQTDMLHETTLSVLRNNPLDVLRIPFWLSRGKANLKQQIATRANFDPALLPYNVEHLEWLKQQKASGRTLNICTASDESVSISVAQYQNIFYEDNSSYGVNNFAC